MKGRNKEPVVDFIIIGAMKAGSTTLVDYMSQNESVEMSKPKEPQFFSRQYEAWSIERYESLWAEPKKTCGEASTCYSRWPYYKNVPQRIYSYNPGMKLIYILRNPIDRAYSHYRHNVLTDGISYSSFDDALLKSDEIVMSSMYMLQIDQFLVFFPRKQILLIDFDEMVKSNLSTINKIEAFLGLELTKENQLKTMSSNQAGIAITHRGFRKRLDNIRNLPVIKFLVDNLFQPNVRACIRFKVDSLIKSSISEKMAKARVNKVDKLNDKQKKYLSDRLRSDIEALEQFWKRDLSHWKE